MSTTGFLLPGQGAQYVGMGQDLYERAPQVRDLYDEANTTLGYKITDICFNGPAEELTATRVCQPAIFLHTVAVATLVRERGERPRMVAGHSLGEYSALVIAGALTFADGLRLIQRRGALVQEAADAHPGAMAAILQLDDDAVHTLCDDLRGDGVLQAANFNAPGQVVISGDRERVRQAMDVAKERGARRAIALAVSGAFHSPHMESARAGMDAAFAEIELRDPDIPIVSNVTAQAMTTATDLRRNLVAQLVSPVRWHESMAVMIAAGCDTFIEMGPGKVLQGLLKRINRATPCRSIDTMTDLDTIEV